RSAPEASPTSSPIPKTGTRGSPRAIPTRSCSHEAAIRASSRASRSRSSRRSDYRRGRASGLSLLRAGLGELDRLTEPLHRVGDLRAVDTGLGPRPDRGLARVRIAVASEGERGPGLDQAALAACLVRILRIELAGVVEAVGPGRVGGAGHRADAAR